MKKRTFFELTARARHRGAFMFRPTRLGFAPMLLALAFSGGAAHALNRDQLRAVVRLPTLDAKFNWGIERIAPSTDEAATKAQIAQLNALATLTGEQLSQLAELYLQQRDSQNADSTFERAVPLLRAALLNRPDEVVQLLQLARALRYAKQDAEAETDLRRAVQIEPQNARAWAQLGELLMSRALQTVVPNSGMGFYFSRNEPLSIRGAGAVVLGSRPTNRNIERAQALLVEARACDLRAAAAPPDENSLKSHIAFLQSNAFNTALVQTLRKDKTATRQKALDSAAQPALKAAFSPEMSDTAQNLARLQPDDVSANAFAALCAMNTFVNRIGGAFPLQGGLATLPDSVSAPVHENFERLQIIAQSGKNEAAALQAVGILKYLTGDLGALDALRRALALDPAGFQARDVLLSLLSKANLFDEMVTVARDQLAREDTARGHLVLAKAFESLNRPQDVQTEIDAALGRNPGDIDALLASAALFLRADDLPQASEQLSKAAPSVATSARPSTMLARNYKLLRAALLGLQNDTEGARKLLQELLTADASDERAQKLLTALNN